MSTPLEATPVSNITPPIGDRFIRKPECRRLTSLSYESIRVREIHHGTFPKRIYLSRNTCVWKLSEVQKWMDDQAANCRREPLAA